jgi:hypothetical protein
MSEGPRQCGARLPPVARPRRNRRYNGVLSAGPYRFDLNDGKGGNRTLDPGIMSLGQGSLTFQ